MKHFNHCIELKLQKFIQWKTMLELRTCKLFQLMEMVYREGTKKHIYIIRTRWINKCEQIHLGRKQRQSERKIVWQREEIGRELKCEMEWEKCGCDGLEKHKQIICATFKMAKMKLKLLALFFGLHTWSKSVIIMRRCERCIHLKEWWRIKCVTV